MKQIALSIFASAILLSKSLEPTTEPVTIGAFIDACIVLTIFVYIIFSDYN